ncbi:FkbM family methyltransferase [Mucilaginibacter sp. SMC90]|uniref:FkbM family methyltransferase n=1 Tax=Mucilaginibacter sp. SMC90 TaxID=2929803 RepID=UPI001FB20741|nr:FkbM family methyltransferase [Mucilaginibacter sp. SMC90]UOE48330.1 FkbM family methyltransferase [Mucilaginibacter sp. SMC90]
MNAVKRTVGFILDHPLGKRHPVKTLWRLVWWQVQLQLSPKKLIVKRFVGPVKFYAKRGLTGITSNIYTGLHEFFDMLFLLHFLKAEDVFFDIGANVGSYTLLASGITGAKSIALEPVKSTFDILSSNIELNALQGKVKLINAGAGPVPGEIRFSADEDTSNHVIAENENSANSIAVPVITIDSLLNQYQPSLIKIDVEGFETEVLKGMTATLNSPALKAIIIELNGSGARYGFNDLDIHNLLLSKNFAAYYYDPFTRQLKNAPSYGTHNTLYCRDLAFVQERIEKATPVKILGEAI